MIMPHTWRCDCEKRWAGVSSTYTVTWRPEAPTCRNCGEKMVEFGVAVGGTWDAS